MKFVLTVSKVVQWTKPHGSVAGSNVCSFLASVIPHLINMPRPYYVFLGCSRSRSTARAFKAFEIEAGNTAGSGHITPLHSPPMMPNSPTSSISSSTTVIDMPELELGPAALESKLAKQDRLAFPLSSFHYQNRFWRLPFLEQKEHSDFRTWIYGFTVRIYLVFVLCHDIDMVLGSVGRPRGRHAASQPDPGRHSVRHHVGW